MNTFSTFSTVLYTLKGVEHSFSKKEKVATLKKASPMNLKWVMGICYASSCHGNNETEM